MGNDLKISILCLITLLLTATAQARPFASGLSSFGPDQDPAVDAAAGAGLPASIGRPAWRVTQVTQLNGTVANVSTSTKPEGIQRMCTRPDLLAPARPAGQCLTCPELQKQMNSSNNTTGAPSFQGWDVQCDLCQEADNFTRSHQYRVNNISACAGRCAQYGNCTVKRDCCRAFTYLPMAAFNNCFLSAGQNSTGTNATWVNATLFKADSRDCVGAVLVAPPPTDFAPATKTCRLCKDFRRDLTQGGYEKWSLHCHLDIPQNDMGVLPDVESLLVDNISQCAEICSKHPCDGSNTSANYSSAFCCQAFTFVYDEVYDQNCFLKGGLTLQTVKFSMAKQWNSRKGCVNTMSAWPMSFNWCQADPQCAEAKDEAAQARADAAKAMQQSQAGLAVSVVSFVCAVAIGLPKLVMLFKGQPDRVVLATPVRVQYADTPPTVGLCKPEAVVLPLTADESRAASPATPNR